MHPLLCVRLAGETTPSWPRARNIIWVSIESRSQQLLTGNETSTCLHDTSGRRGEKGGDWKEEEGGGYCLYPVLLSINIAEKSLGLACESQERKRQACHRPTYETSMK